MEHLSNDYEDCPNQHENSHKLSDETGQLAVNFMESQRKLRQQYQNFPVEGKPLKKASEEKNKSKRAGM